MAKKKKRRTQDIRRGLPVQPEAYYDPTSDEFSGYIHNLNINMQNILSASPMQVDNLTKTLYDAYGKLVRKEIRELIEIYETEEVNFLSTLGNKDLNIGDFIKKMESLLQDSSENEYSIEPIFAINPSMKKFRDEVKRKLDDFAKILDDKTIKSVVRKREDEKIARGDEQESKKLKDLWEKRTADFMKLLNKEIEKEEEFRSSAEDLFENILKLYDIAENLVTTETLFGKKINSFVIEEASKIKNKIEESYKKLPSTYKKEGKSIKENLDKIREEDTESYTKFLVEVSRHGNLEQFLNSYTNTMLAGNVGLLFENILPNIFAEILGEVQNEEKMRAVGKAISKFNVMDIVISSEERNGVNIYYGISAKMTAENLMSSQYILDDFIKKFQESKKGKLGLEGKKALNLRKWIVNNYFSSRARLMPGTGPNNLIMEAFEKIYINESEIATLIVVPRILTEWLDVVEEKQEKVFQGAPSEFYPLFVVSGKRVYLTSDILKKTYALIGKKDDAVFIRSGDTWNKKAPNPFKREKLQDLRNLKMKTIKEAKYRVSYALLNNTTDIRRVLDDLNNLTKDGFLFGKTRVRILLNKLYNHG